jgi:hypothetical protein
LEGTDEQSSLEPIRNRPRHADGTLCASLAICVGASADGGGSTQNATTSKEQITVLYDAFGKVTAMEKDWGFAALVEVGGMTYLLSKNPSVKIYAPRKASASMAPHCPVASAQKLCD